MDHRFTTLIVLFLLFFPFILHADEVYKLEDIVVSATKMPEKRMDISNSVIIKDEKDIEMSGAKTVGELLANEPGIDWQTYGDYGGSDQSIHIRGMGADATQVFINGVNVNSPSLGTADLGRIPVENIEKIEVVKGSGSLLYGSGAMGGTVNIFTKGPKRDKIDLKVSAGYGSQNTYRIYAQHGMFLTRDFGYYLTAGKSATDGFRDNGHLSQYDASVKLVLDKGAPLNITLYGNYLARRYGMPGVKPPDGTPETVFYNSESANLLDYSKDKDGNISLEVKGNPIKQLAYNVKGYYSNMLNNNYERYASIDTGTENWINNTVSGVEGNVSIYPFDGAKFLAGGEYKDYSWKNKSYDLVTAGIRTATTDDDAHIYTKGIFAEGEYRPIKYLKAIAGIRQENHSAFGKENLPLFGLVVNPSDTMVFKASHGRHFKAPTPNDLYWPAGPYTSGNPDLKPEIGWHSDITYEQSFLKNRIFVTLSYFRWNINNKIQWEPDSNGLWKPINLGEYKADGVEAGVRIGPFYNLELSLNYTYTDAQEQGREYTRQDYGWPPFIPADFRYNIVKRRATMVPIDQFKGELTYRTDFGLTATFIARYTGNRVSYRTQSTVYPDTTTVRYTISPFWTADLKLEQRLLGHWIVSLAGYNLFDEYYDTHMGTFTDVTGNSTVSGYPGAGRSVFMNFAYEF